MPNAGEKVDGVGVVLLEPGVGDGTQVGPGPVKVDQREVLVTTTHLLCSFDDKDCFTEPLCDRPRRQDLLRDGGNGVKGQLYRCFCIK